MRYFRAYTWALLAFLWAPLLGVFWKGLSVTAFRRLLANADILVSFRNSLFLAVGAALLSVAAGLATAFALPLMPSRLRRWMLGSLLLPLVLPEIAFGLAYLVCFRSAGIPLGWATMLLSHFAFTFCYVVLVLKNGVAQLDPSLADAVRDLGGNSFTVFRHAILPQLIPSLVAGAMMAFSLSLDDFLISFFVKGVDQLTLPVKVFSMMRLGIGPELYALSVVLFGFSFLSVIITQVWLYRSQNTRR